MPLAWAWGKAQTILLVLAVIVALVLVVLMATKKPGPDEVAEGGGSEGEPSGERKPEVEEPEAEEEKQ
jgi:preprotein translocase subunit SecG